MGWTDKIGEAVDNIVHAKGGPVDVIGNDVLPKIGAVWSAAGGDDAAEAIWNHGGKQVASPIDKTLQGLSWTYSHAVARPISTFGQVTIGGSGMDGLDNRLSYITDGKSWSDAWNQSDTFTPGQVIATGLLTGTGAKDLGPAPFSAGAEKQRQDFYRNEWPGRVLSGGIDAALSWYSDPTVLALGKAKAVRVAGRTLPAEDRAAALAASLKDVTPTVKTLDEAPPTEAEKGALDTWLGDHFTEINDAARKGESHPLSEHLDSLLKRAVNPEEQTLYRTVHRGTLDADFAGNAGKISNVNPVDNLKVGDTFTSKGYDAVDRDPDVANLFPHEPRFLAPGNESLPVVMKVTVPPGQNVLDVGKIKPEGDGEFLLPRGTKYKITADGTATVNGLAGPQQVRQLAVEVIDGGIKPAKGTDRWGKKISKIYTATDGKTASEIATMPEMKDTADAGVIAHFLGEANRLHPGEDDADKLARWTLKSQIMGVALGDTSAIQKLKESQAALADEYDRLGQAPRTTDAIGKFSWEDNGQGAMDLFDDAADKSLQIRKDEISKDMLRMQRLADTYASTSKVGHSIPEAIGAKMQQYKLHETVVPSSFGGTATRYVVGNAQTRVPGFVHVKDPSRGFDDVLNVLAQAKHTSAADKKIIADRFVSAATDGDRRNAVAAMESKVFSDYATKNGMKPDEAKKLLDKLVERRTSYATKLQSRLYSAAGDPENPWVHIHDAEEDIDHIFSRPLLQSQLESAAAVSDPRVIEKMFSEATNKRVLERWLNPKAADALDGTKDALDHLAGMYTRGWKDLMLMRGAYPVRIQVDTQLRLMATMSKMQYMMSLKNGIAGTTKYLLESKDRDGKSIKNFFKEADAASAAKRSLQTNKEYFGFPISPALNDAEGERIIARNASTGGSIADLGNEVESAILRGDRATGNWGRVDPTDKEWYGNWKRAVQQIKGSAVARRSVIDDDVDSLRKWVNETPEARAEWVNLSEGYSSQDQWLSAIIAHTKHYLPTPELRGIVAKGEGKLDEMATEKLNYLETTAARNKTGMATDEEMQRYNSTFQAHEYAQAELKLARKDYSRLQKKYAAARKQPARSGGSIPKKEQVATARVEFQAAKARRTEALRKAEKAVEEHKPNKALAGSVEQANRNVIGAQNVIGSAEGDIGTWTGAEKFFTDNQDLRMAVHGENYSPLHATPYGKIHQAVRKAWFNIAADMPETIMGRAPLYRVSYERAMKESIDRLDEDGLALADVDGLRRAADKKARKEVGQILFDSSDTSNAAHALRAISPFFAAWEDTMKKWGKLVYADPGLAVKFNKGWNAPNNANLVVDSEGNHVDGQGHTYDTAGNRMDGKKGYRGNGEYVVLPKALGGFLVPGGGQLKINKKSINILFQGNPPWLPGVGPLVSVPTNEISKRMFPDKVDSNPILKYVLPYGNTNDSVVDQAVLPAWIQQGKDAFGDSKAHANTYTMLFAQEKQKYDNGDRKTMPTDKEISNRTRNWFILRAALGNVAPVTIAPQSSSQLYIDKAHQYQAKYGAQWQDKFYEDFPQYFDLSVSLSANDSGINATDDGYEAWKKYKTDIKANKDLGWFYAGPENLTGEFDPNIYNQQFASGLRSTKDAQQAIAGVDAAKGWIQYTKATTWLNLQMEQRGLTSLQQKGAEDLLASKQEFVRQLSETNDAWRVDYGQRDTTKIQTMVNAATTKWAKDPAFAKRSDQVALKAYLDGRTWMQQQLATRESKSLTAAGNDDLAQTWGQYTTQLKQGSPAFEQIFNRLLEADDLSQELNY